MGRFCNDSTYNYTPKRLFCQYRQKGRGLASFQTHYYLGRKIVWIVIEC